jgi:hypothetical protein
MSSSSLTAFGDVDFSRSGYVIFIKAADASANFPTTA